MKSNEKGYAIIIMLVLSAALFIVLSGAMAALFSFASQNKQLQKDIQRAEESIN